MKNVIDIRDEFFDNGNKISVQSMQDLIWHLENDPSPDRAISLATDARLMELVPLIAKHLDNEDDFIRELAVGCVVGRLQVAEYAEKALNIAQEDPDSGPRSLATSSLGAVINKVVPGLQKKIATYLYSVVVCNEYKSSHKRCAFDAVLKAMNIPAPQRISTPYNANHELLQQFKVKYNI